MRIEERTIDYETQPVTGHFTECHNCEQDTRVEEAIPIDAGGKEVVLCEFCYDTMFDVTPLFRVSDDGDRVANTKKIREGYFNRKTLSGVLFAFFNLFAWLVGLYTIFMWVFPFGSIVFG